MAIYEYKAEVELLLRNFPYHELENITRIIEVRRRSHGTVWVAGNGGSAANASHCAAHLIDAGVRAVCLSDCAPLMTARGNDVSYGMAFADSLPDGRMRPEDMALVFSCSGQSANVLNLLERARKCNAGAAGMFGFKDHAKGPRMCDAALVLDSRNMGAIEDCHSMAIHMMKEMLIK